MSGVHRGARQLAACMAAAVGWIGCTMLALTAANAVAVESASANYSLKWDVLDSGGGTTMSSNFLLTDSVAQTAVGEAASAGYLQFYGFETPPDTDTDRVKDFMDNCIEVMNTEQIDSNADGFGNACDADLSNDNVINFIDLGIMKSVFFTADADADFNDDGFVNFIDLAIMKAAFFGPPGPSGIAP